MSELEIKTGWDILREVDNDVSYSDRGLKSKKGLSSKRWVSLDSLKALLAEQLKELERMPFGDGRLYAENLLVLLEERLK